MSRDDKYICWLENINMLFNNCEIIPNNSMSFGEKINSITKLLIVISLLLIIFNVFDYNIIFIYFLISLMIIILFYYKEKENMSSKRNQNNVKEPFEISYLKSQNSNNCEKHSARIVYNCANNTEVRNDSRQKIIDNIENNKNNMKINFNTADFNHNFKRKTDNQHLVGAPNPKTLVAPVIAPPLASLESWKNDDEYNISTLNVVKPRYEYESGYKTSQDYNCYSKLRVPPSYTCGYKKKILKKEVSTQFKNQSQSQSQPQPQDTKKEVKENFTFPYEIKSEEEIEEDKLDGSELFYKDFKTNPSMKDKYTDNIFAYNNDPDDSYVNKRNEPINSLIGITEPGQFEENEYEMIEPHENINMSNTYDPRFYGYGTSYRGYVDKVVGQPRFYYDDINAIKMPNYITRNSIDVTPFGDSYGPDNHGGNEYHSNITKLADKHYLDSALQFRTEMQNRLMRKVNSESWQQKMYPIQRRGHRMMK